MVAAPLTPHELLERADLAGYGRVIAKRDGIARVRFTKLLKGRQPGAGLLSIVGLQRSVSVRLHPRLLNPMLGDWWDEDAYVVGATVLTHLCWNERGKCYETLWWNAVEIIKPAS